jgi:hypothetical protein
MRTIYKYPIAVVDQQTLRLPAEAEILCVQMQGEQPCIWALVTPNATTKDRDIRVYGTGHRMPDETASHRYIGTIQMAAGSLVFHVFEAGL